MEKNNIHVLTNNHYLYEGINLGILQHLDCICIHLDPYGDNEDIYHNCTGRDIFIFFPEYYRIKCSILMQLKKRNACVIIVQNEIEWGMNSILKISSLPRKFLLSELLQSISSRKVANREMKVPCFTSREEKVLLMTQKGLSIAKISSFLNVTRKTTYSHQRSALRKIGLRKYRDILRLPDDFIKFVCGIKN